MNDSMNDDDDQFGNVVYHLGVISGALGRPGTRDDLIAMLRKGGAGARLGAYFDILFNTLSVVRNALVEEDEERDTLFRARSRALMLMPVDALWRDGYECGTERAARELAVLRAHVEAVFENRSERDK